MEIPGTVFQCLKPEFTRPYSRKAGPAHHPGPCPADSGPQRAHLHSGAQWPQTGLLGSQVDSEPPDGAKYWVLKIPTIHSPPPQWPGLEWWQLRAREDLWAGSLGPGTGLQSRGSHAQEGSRSERTRGWRAHLATQVGNCLGPQGEPAQTHSHRPSASLGSRPLCPACAAGGGAGRLLSGAPRPAGLTRPSRR